MSLSLLISITLLLVQMYHLLHPLTAAKGPHRGVVLIPECARTPLAVLLGLTRGSARGREGRREGGDGVVTSRSGREIEVDDERREIKRGVLAEQREK